MHKTRTMLAGLGTAALLATVSAPMASAAPADAQEWGACASGNVCFYTGTSGTGSKCSWSVADEDWTQGSIRCSWSQTHHVKSVWNRGTSSASGVAYYQWANYNTRKGCTPQGARGNLAGTYMLKSHRWISGSCG
ncbi:peptidase inhibitor family I36 protein [Streptomyces sp. NPDC003016]